MDPRYVGAKIKGQRGVEPKRVRGFRELGAKSIQYSTVCEDHRRAGLSLK